MNITSYHRRKYIVSFFSVSKQQQKLEKKKHVYTQTHTDTLIQPTNPKNVCYLKILNLNVNSRMKIYWIKNHVKQTIKKEYQKKIAKTSMFQLISRLFFYSFFVIVVWLAMLLSLLAIACRLARTHTAWIRERCCAKRENPVVNNKLWQRHMIG